MNERVKWLFTKRVKVPKNYRKFLWDYPSGFAPLEIFLLRILTYGKFEDVKQLYEKYSDECLSIAERYNNLKRGVKFWLRYWNERKI